jgi:hypothetical protein
MAMSMHEARGAVGQASKRALPSDDTSHPAVERTRRRLDARDPMKTSTGIRSSSEGLASDPLHPPDVAGLGSGEAT